MKKIEIFSYKDIKNEVFRLKGRELRTNFFLTERMFNIIREKKLIEVFQTDNGCYLCVEDEGFDRFYFIVKDLAELQQNISEFFKDDNRIVTSEIVGNKKYLDGVVDVFTNSGFTQYTSLVRMSKAKQNKVGIALENIYLLPLSRKNDILGLFHEYFDKFAERIPTDEEMEQLIKDNCVYYYSDSDEIQGFIIFENHGFTSHLRYWFVHPQYRDKKIGSKLIDLFFAKYEEVRRELFWVIESNENAVKRYRHFGFKEEDMHNVIMINKNLKYEG